MQNILHLDPLDFQNAVEAVVAGRPLVHCMTNDVVQEITADVLLAAGASPAMVITREESADFCRLADALLINVGTLTPERFQAMVLAVQTAGQCNKPWVLDPVAAGPLPWRNARIEEFLTFRPSVIRANASEILALAGLSKGGHGVDSLDDSADAIEAACALAQQFECTVAVTGPTDFVTDGKRLYAIEGGHKMATLVVGTGCSLSALVAAFCAVLSDRTLATAAALQLAKKAQERARAASRGPGSFHPAYLDALYELSFTEHRHDR